MDKTPIGDHEIRKISGNAEDIVTRGKEIKSLGVQMIEAAAVLEMVKDGAETRGKSLEKIKDSVGDAAGDLKKAGDRYEPSGTHVLAYGNSLSSAQLVIDVVVPEAERLWGIYEAKLAAWLEATGVPVPVPDPDAEPVPGQSDPAEERQDNIADALTAKNKAREDWELEAGKYDAPFESWAVAYESARAGLQKANDDGIEDSFWDNALPAIDVILTVLSYAGAVLAVLAIIIGGPFIAIIAAVVGLVVLGLTIWKVAAGRGNGWDIAVAVVGILPFGKIFGAFKGVIKAAPGAKLVALGRGGRDVLTDLGGLTNLRQIRHLDNVVSAGATRRILHGSGDLNTNGTARLRERFAAMAGASGNGGLADAFDAGSATVRNRVTSILDETYSGHVVQGMIDSGRGGVVNTVLNITDSVVKPAGNFAYDRATGGWGF